MDIYLITNILFGSFAVAGFCVGVLNPRRIPSPLDCVVLAFVFTCIGFVAAFAMPGLVLITVGIGFLAMAFAKSISAIVFWVLRKTPDQ